MATYIIFGANGQIANHFFNKHAENQENHFILIDKNWDEKSFTYSPNAIKFNIDLRKSTDFKPLIDYLINEDIKIDFLLFSVGINYANNFFESNIDEFENTMRININSLFLTMKNLYKFMNNQSSVVALASQNGIVGHEERIDYGPSKAAMIQFVRNLSVDLANNNEKDIKVNSVSPGYIISDNSLELFNSIKGKKMIKRIPYKKLVTLDNVVDVIQFLFSTDSDAIRGQNIVVDYGYTIV